MRDGPLEIEEALATLEHEQSERLWVTYSDYNGRTQAKSVEPSSFASALRKGLNFARANLEFNLLNQMTDRARFTADTGDFYATPDLSTLCQVPYHPGTARGTAWMRDDAGNHWEGCPRFALQCQIDALADAGIKFKVAFEPEAFLFRRDGEGTIVPADRAGMYSLDRLEIHADFFAEVAASLGQMGIKVEQLGAEYGTGQVEINIGHAEPLKAADDLVLFRDVFKAISRKHDLIGSFMPKPFESGAGSGLHIHLSLWSSDGDDLMADPAAPDGISTTGKSFIAGLLKHAPALTGLGAPTVNSYKRLLPGSWAPAHAAWGVGDRGVMIRVPSATKPRIEVRCGDNTAQPYLFLAGILAAGLDGISQSLTPIPASSGDIGHFSRDAAIAAGHQFLPRNVNEALDAVEQDAVMHAALGDVIHGEWLKVKRSEAAAHAIVVTEWERDLYLEF
jgi:glutamine synthetase